MAFKAGNMAPIKSASFMATTIFTKKILGLETGKPGADSHSNSPPATTFPKKPKMSASKSKKREIPEGL